MPFEPNFVPYPAETIKMIESDINDAVANIKSHHIAEDCYTLPYIGNDEIFAGFVEYVTSRMPQKPVVLYGTHGCGKSTCLRLLEQYLQQNMKLPVISIDCEQYKSRHLFQEELQRELIRKLNDKTHPLTEYDLYIIQTQFEDRAQQTIEGLIFILQTVCIAFSALNLCKNINTKRSQNDTQQRNQF